MSIPTTLAATISGPVLAELEEKLGPPAAARTTASFEIEVELVGEGTFVLAYDGNALTGRKGMARGDPLTAMRLSKGSWPFVQELLQAALDGFPGSRELATQQRALRALSRADFDRLVQAIAKLKPVAVVVDVKGLGTFELARGSLEEVTRRMTVTVDGAAVRAVLAGAPLTGMRVVMGGDRAVGTDVAAAFAPLWLKLRAP